MHSCNACWFRLIRQWVILGGLTACCTAQWTLMARSNHSVSMGTNALANHQDRIRVHIPCVHLSYISFIVVPGTEASLQPVPGWESLKRSGGFQDEALALPSFPRPMTGPHSPFSCHLSSAGLSCQPLWFSHVNTGQQRGSHRLINKQIPGQKNLAYIPIVTTTS